MNKKNSDEILSSNSMSPKRFEHIITYQFDITDG